MQTINMQTIFDFFRHDFFTVVGGMTTLLLILGMFYKIASYFLGITPIAFRLGISIWNREIVIFSDIEKYKTLKKYLMSSYIFKEKNISHIEKYCSIKINTKNNAVFLVDWNTYSDKITDVLNARNSTQTSVIIYAKSKEIPCNQFNQLAELPNTLVVNFKGRLLSDILSSLITTSYDKQ